MPESTVAPAASTRPSSPSAAAAAKEKKATNYVVLYADTAAGPFTVHSNQTTFGQANAKKAAAADMATSGGDLNPEDLFFVAVPASSFAPQKPVIQMVITFLNEEGVADESEGDDDDGDDGTDGEDAELLEALDEIANG